MHELKIWPEYFEAKIKGVKPWEYRLNDRNFQVGDRLDLKEYDPIKNEYTGRSIIVNVEYIYQVDDSMVIMSDDSGKYNFIWI